MRNNETHGHVDAYPPGFAKPRDVGPAVRCDCAVGGRFSDIELDCDGSGGLLYSCCAGCSAEAIAAVSTEAAGVVSFVEYLGRVRAISLLAWEG